VRQLSSDVGFAPGSVARAYSILEVDALIESLRGAGTRVRHRSSHSRTLVLGSERLIRKARVNHLTLEQTVQIIWATWA
jgi:GntR family transcriptional regulator